MAPESERANKCADCGELPEHWRHQETLASRDSKDSVRHAFVQPHIPPTLTCSEVVERLARDCHKAVCTCEHTQCWCESDDKQACERCRRLIDDVRAQATAILHSWRERRVQELENCLGEIALTLKVGHGVGVAEQCRLYAENTLAKSDEWREQIRKGAKHD